MEKPIPLESLFKEKIFRIPDYQRGYAWGKEQFQAFWEDLDNLPSNRSHYTGVLTLNAIPETAVSGESREFWLVDGQSYKIYNVIDGQQRLTTFIILMQAFAEFFEKKNPGKTSNEIDITETLRLSDLNERYIFRVNPKGQFRTYMFGYTEDNPSQDYLRYKIFREDGAGSIQETFYTLNLVAAKDYFSKQIDHKYEMSGQKGLIELYRKLTKKFLFKEYIIDDDFDVFVAFETMNNRGKKLSDLELLKNRLIYLTTLFPKFLIDEAGRKVLRDEINAAWKETYHQLGRNKTSPLNDDDFLRALWIVLFKYSRKTGRDYADFLLNRYFNPRHVLERHGIEVPQESIIERRADDIDDVINDQEGGHEAEAAKTINENLKISPEDVRTFVSSLKQSAPHWFASFYPDFVEGMSDRLQISLERLNRIGMGYFRTLVMVVLKSETPEDDKIQLFESVERFIFLMFRLGSQRSNFRSSEFYNAARELNRGEISLKQLVDRLDVAVASTFSDEGFLKINSFHDALTQKFKDGSGYYGWSDLKYFLFEYEQSLLDSSRQRKVSWSDLLKPGDDRVSIEHIYPQTSTPEWDVVFADVSPAERKRYSGSLGNLLLLSMSINSSLQNDSFVSKKSPNFNQSGKKTRNGYADGSHSEIEVAQYADWGPGEIIARGEKLLRFMEVRWKFKLRAEDRLKLLFI
jgi:hypothetical protein